MLDVTKSQHFKFVLAEDKNIEYYIVNRINN